MTTPPEAGLAAGNPRYAPKPGTVPHPGELLLEWLQDNNRSQAWFARAIGVSTEQVNRITKGKAMYSATMALRFAHVTGVSARFWMHLLADYQLNQAELDPPKLSYRRPVTS